MFNNDEKLYSMIEYAIEFAWQVTDNPNQSRAEHRHKVADAVLEFVKINKQIPKDDVDEFIGNFLKKHGNFVD